jgi:hypothetical protein
MSSPISVTSILDLDLHHHHEKEEERSNAQKQLPLPLLPPSNNSPPKLHPVSLTALLHLKQYHGDWLADTELRLRCKSNGTFVLEFPCRTPLKNGRHAGRIWTSYDANTNEHWLLVYRRKVICRFLLLSNCDNNELIIIQEAVDEMVDTLVHLETKLG